MGQFLPVGPTTEGKPLAGLWRSDVTGLAVANAVLAAITSSPP